MTRPLRLLHIIPYFNPAWAYGGSVRVASELCARLVERGHHVTVLTTDTCDAHYRLPAGKTSIDGIQVIRYRNLSNLLAWKRLFMPLTFGVGLARRMQEYDIVHLHEYRSLQNAFALPALLRTQKPYVLMPHGGLPAELGRTGMKHVYDALVGQRLVQRATGLHALTDMEQQQYLDLGLPAERTVLIPNGIDVQAYDIQASGVSFRQQFGIPSGQPVVGYLGRLSHIKGLDFLIEAFALLLTHQPAAILSLVGPDDGAQSALQQQVVRLGIEASVRFTGMIDDIQAKAAAYRAFDVYVLPSRYENQPTTVLEALLNQTPCIVTDRCGLAEELSGNHLARVVSFGDMAGLAQEMAELAQLPGSPAEAERRRAYVLQHFNWDVITTRWEDFYRQCLDHDRSSG